MKYFRIAERPNMYIYPWYIAELANTKDMWDVFGLGVKESVFLLKTDTGTWYIDEDSSDKLGKFLFDKIISEPDFFQKVIGKIYSESRKVQTFSKKISTLRNITEISNRKLLLYYEDYIHKLRILRTWGAVPVFVDGLKVNYLSDHALAELKNYLESREKGSFLNKYYSILSSSDKPSDIQKEMLSRLKMLIKIEKKTEGNKILEIIDKGKLDEISAYPEIIALLEGHIKKFSWLTYSYSGPPMAGSDLHELIQEVLKSKKNLKDMYSYECYRYEEIKKDKKRIIRKEKIPEKIQWVFKMMSELMYIKDYRKGIYQRSYLAMDRVMGELSRRVNIGIKEIKYLTYEEVQDMVLNNRSEYYTTLVRERLSECSYVVRNGEIKVYSGKENQKIISQKIGNEISEHATSSGIIKGMIAYPGKVTGIARIVLTRQDVPKIKEGNILISSATNPDLIIAIKRAVGIVTDTGGIISHAAIVSRELKIPCVVGTHTGTQVIHDGDYIELDAERGVVTIIKKAAL